MGMVRERTEMLNLTQLPLYMYFMQIQVINRYAENTSLS